MGTKNQSSDQLTQSKKKRRVGFSKIDAGVEANECFKIYLVSAKEEVGSLDNFCITPVDLNHFFEDDGKIYGYQGLKVTVWVSSISLHAYADISFDGTSDGGKGITDLKSALLNMFAENLVENKDDFIQTFSTDCHYVRSVVSKGQPLQLTDTNRQKAEELSQLEVVRVVGDPVGHVYSRLVPFVLLLIDGSNPIDVTDPQWEIYLLVQKPLAHQEDGYLRILGFAAVYRFDRYPDGKRLRLGQILVLPPYQRKGYGSYLLEVLGNIAVSEDVYDLTIEEPEDSLQHVRTVLDVKRLLSFASIQEELSSIISRLKQEKFSKKRQLFQIRPTSTAVEDVRKSLKINKRQFFQCWEVLIYLGLDPTDNMHMENFQTIISSRIKTDVIGKDSEGSGKRVVDVDTEYDQEMSFVMFKSGNRDSQKPEMDENASTQEEQLRSLVQERIKHIKKIAEKVSKDRL